MFKDFLLRKMLKSQMKGVPEAEQEKMLKLIEDNPDLFQKIAMDAQTKMKSGMDQMSAIREATQAHAEELGKIAS